VWFSLRRTTVSTDSTQALSSASRFQLSCWLCPEPILTNDPFSQEENTFENETKRRFFHSAPVRGRGSRGQELPCPPAKNASFLNFSYVCPEPVLVKRSHLYINCSKRLFFAYPSERLVVAEASDLHMLLIQEEPLVTGPHRCINANAHLTHRTNTHRTHTQNTHRTYTENAKTRKRKTKNRVETSRIVELELHHQHKTTLALASVRLKIRSSTKTGSGQTRKTT
jgi:hypothetical protein